MSDKRRSLTQEDHRRWSRLTCSRLEGLLSALGARSVGVYAPVKGETDLAWLWSGGPPRARSYYFPRISENDMTFHVAGDPGKELRPGAFGIPAPSSAAPSKSPSALEALVLPGLAFDIFGGRVGSGGGYYDRLLGALRNQGAHRNRPRLVGVGFSFQLEWKRSLPMESFDVLMDWIVTNRECVRCLPCSYT